MTGRTQPPGDDGEPTERQQGIVDFIRRYMGLHGHSPTQREIAHGVGLSVSTVNYHMTILTEMGSLTCEAGLPRTIVAKPPRLRVIRGMWDEFGKTLVGADSGDMVTMPLFDQIPAGATAPANAVTEETIRLPREKVGHGRLFAARVAGKSMAGAEIQDGDYVVVREQQVADDGDIVAARIDDEGTVKTFRRVNGHVWLMPENPSYPPIPGDDCRLMGKVVAVVRI